MGYREQGAVASLLLALTAAAVLGTGLLLVVNRSVVDQAAVTAEPGTGTGTGTSALEPAGGDTAPARGTAADGPTGGVIGDTATTRPEPSSGLPAPGAPPADDADSVGAGPAAASPDPGSPDLASPDPATSGTDDTTSAPVLPYGTAAAERTTAQAPGELARTGPAVPSSVAVLLVTAGLVLAAVARAAAPGDD